MRINDWSSDVCSSDLDAAAEKEVRVMSDVIEFRPKAGASGVIATPTHEEITHALRECHSESLLAVTRGRFGVGKTHTLERYVAAHASAAALVHFSPWARSVTSDLRAAAQAGGQPRGWHI